MPNVDGKDYPYTDKGVKNAKKDAKSSGKSMSYHNPGPEKEDVRRAAMSMLDRLPEVMDKEKVAGISISLMFNQPTYKKSKKDFEPHAMHDPETGEEHKADSYEKHMEMKGKGFTHDKPKSDEEEEDDQA